MAKLTVHVTTKKGKTGYKMFESRNMATKWITENKKVLDEVHLVETVDLNSLEE